MTQKIHFNNLTGNSITIGNTVIDGTGITTDGETVAGIKADIYANNASLPLSGLTAGKYAYTTANTTLFYTDGNGWYKVTTINETPSVTLSVDSVTLGAGGNTADFTYTVTDEGPVTITVSNSGIANTSLANVQHYTSNNTITVNNVGFSEANSFTVTVSASDGINIGTATANVALTYGPVAPTVTGTYTETTVGSDIVYKFTGAGSMVFTADVDVEYLIVAGGGGGGGQYYSGGGGAGGVIKTTSATSWSSGTYNISVGSGGDGGDSGNTSRGNNGGNSTISGGVSLTAIGGGGGGVGYNSSTYGPGANGGSGGGGGGRSYAGGNGTSGQGNDGADGNGTGINGGGGGGAGGAAPATSASVTATNGGAGIQSNITGSNLWYAAGGGGFAFAGTAGIKTRTNGIGGATAVGTSTAFNTLQNAVDGTGSGGGGWDQRQSGGTRAGDGGDGVVIVRVKNVA